MSPFGRRSGHGDAAAGGLGGGGLLSKPFTSSRPASVEEAVRSLTACHHHDGADICQCYRPSAGIMVMMRRRQQQRQE